MSKVLFMMLTLLSVACGGTARSSEGIPSKRSIVHTLRDVSLSTCLNEEPHLKGQGKIKVKITAVNSGEITKVKVINSPYRDSTFAKCLESNILRLKFESFSAPEIVFTFPFKN